MCGIVETGSLHSAQLAEKTPNSVLLLEHVLEGSIRWVDFDSRGNRLLRNLGSYVAELLDATAGQNFLEICAARSKPDFGNQSRRDLRQHGIGDFLALAGMGGETHELQLGGERGNKRWRELA